MKQCRHVRWALLLGLVVILGGQVIAHAQTGGGYDLTWNLAGGSGGAMSGGAYALVGSAGQAAAGTLSGGSYALNGGFWTPPHLLSKRLYLPMTLKGGS